MGGRKKKNRGGEGWFLKREIKKDRRMRIKKIEVFGKKRLDSRRSIIEGGEERRKLDEDGRKRILGNSK